MRFVPQILLLSVIAIPLILVFYLNFNGLYGQDAYEYLKFSMEIGLSKTSQIMWPVNYPLAGRILNFLIPEPARAMQLVSILSYSLSGFLIYDHLRQKTNTSKFVLLFYVIIFFTFSPYVFRFSTLVMSEMLCLFFIVLTFHQVFLKEIKDRNLVFAVIAASLAIGTRYVALLIVAVPVLYVIKRAISGRHVLPLMIAILAGILGLVPQVLLKDNRPSDHIRHNFLLNWSPVNFFSQSTHTNGGQAYDYAYSNFIEVISYISHPVFNYVGILLLLLLAALIIRHVIQPPPAVYWLSFIIYIVFLTGLPVQNRRFFIIVYPVLLMMLFPAWNFMANTLNHRWFIALSGFLLVTQISLCVVAEKTVIEISNSEKEYVRKLREFNHERLPVYNSGLDGIIQYEFPEVKFHSLFHDTLPLPKGRLILMIDSQQVFGKFRGSLLERNTELLYRQMTIVRNTEIGRWKLYEFGD